MSAIYCPQSHRPADAIGNRPRAQTPRSRQAVRAACRRGFRASVISIVLGVSASPAQDGGPDPAFGDNGLVLLELPFLPLTAQALPNGRLLVGGETRSPLPARRAAMVRLLPDGQPDPSFGDGGMTVLPDLPSLELDELESVSFTGISLLDDGRILAMGSIGAWALAGPERRCALLAMFDAGGDLMPDFGEGGAACVGEAIAPNPSPGQILRAPAFALATDGILISEVRTWSTESGASREPKRLFKVDFDGALIPGFGVGGVVEFDESSPILVYAIAVDSVGRILVGSSSAVARLDGSGGLDDSYGDEGVSVLVLPKGWSISNRYGVTLTVEDRLDLVSDFFCIDACGAPGGSFRSHALSRRLHDGTLDPSLATGESPPVPGLVAWTASGDTLEIPEPPGMIETRMLTQPDGRTVFLGQELLRLDVDGSRDCAFGQVGHSDAGWTDYSAQALAFGGDNRLWIIRRIVLAQPGSPEDVLEVRKYVAEGVFSDGFRDRNCGKQQAGRRSQREARTPKD